MKVKKIELEEKEKSCECKEDKEEWEKEGVVKEGMKENKRE